MNHHRSHDSACQHQHQHLRLSLNPTRTPQYFPSRGPNSLNDDSCTEEETEVEEDEENHGPRGEVDEAVVVEDTVRPGPKARISAGGVSTVQSINEIINWIPLHPSWESIININRKS